MIYADDTRSETREILLELWRNKTESERAIHGFRLWNSFKNRIISAIYAEKPDITPSELMVESFRRVYHHDFTPDEMERICTRIREFHLKNPPCKN